jgi:predicted transcriptional regulator
MPKKPPLDLSRRERQIMLVLFERGPSTAQQVLEALPDPPSYSAVRTMLRLLEEKEQITHHQEGPRYVYTPVVSREKAQRSALRQTVQSFFDNSVEQAMATLIGMDDLPKREETLDRLEQLIQHARNEGR